MELCLCLSSCFVISFFRNLTRMKLSLASFPLILMLFR